MSDCEKDEDDKTFIQKLVGFEFVSRTQISILDFTSYIDSYWPNSNMYFIRFPGSYSIPIYRTAY